MVIQRLKLEIIKKCDQPVSSLTSLQHLESINGLEMFGFLSLHIVQVTANFSHLPVKLSCSESSCGEKVRSFSAFWVIRLLSSVPFPLERLPCWHDHLKIPIFSFISLQMFSVTEMSAESGLRANIVHR